MTPTYCYTNARCGYRKNGICGLERFCPSQFKGADLLKLGDALLFWRDEGELDKVQKVQEKIDHMKSIIDQEAVTRL